jgi:hypothetical protein
MSKIFMKSIEVSPNTDAIKYLSLAELVGGDEAILNFNTGISILLKEKANLIKQVSRKQIT